ncbi:hypothetical protein VSDG_06395 [Cytospora chrysosperma]|uniref:Uncharacterized protein n=1 Tax=Cytospora chrysosperma TaxID=252740 RepID=A0A423VPF6_CYTCH|nr:hypothetical protein VSDG_06395 [Valsa sordida]
MLAAHKDQENLVSIHQANAVTKQQNQGSTRSTLQPKTPGTRYPKTPLRIPLNDENAVRALGAKSFLANKPNGDKAQQWVTPAEPRTGRAVLGDKTTNAKARASQQALGKTPAKTTTVSRPKSSAPKPEAAKLQILQDTSFDPLSSEPDTNAPPPEPLPYESDVWPAGVLTFDAIRPENRLNGYYEYYHNRRDENGMTRLDREMKAAQEKRFREADAKIRKDLDEDFKWDLGLLDSPRKTQQVVPARDPEPVGKKVVRPSGMTRPLSTISSRRAVSALGMASKLPTASAIQRRPLTSRSGPSTNAAPSKLPSFMQPTVSKPRPAATAPRATPSSTAGLAASRSTLGYTKGRNASSAIRVARKHARSGSEASSRPLTRTASTASGSSDATVTPANYAKGHVEARPEFVSIFDEPPKDNSEDDDDIDCSLFGKDVGDGGAAGDLLDDSGDENDESGCHMDIDL